MKKNILFMTILFIFISLSTYAVDFGGLIDNTTSTQGRPERLANEISNSSVATLWLKTPFDINNKSYFVIEGFYKFNWSNSDKKISHLLDISLLKIGMNIDISNNFSFSADFGRFLLSDATSLIITQPLDGLLFQLNSKVATVYLYTGYTGLLNANTVFFNSDGVKEKQDNLIYTFAEPFIVSNLTATFPRAFAGQTPAIEFYGIFDIKNGLQRIYGTLSSSGPIINNFFYTLSSTLGMTQHKNDNLPGLSNLSTVNIMWYTPVLNSSISFNTVFATGGKGTKAFHPFTISAQSIAGHSLSNIFKPGIMATIKPLQSLFLSLTSDAYFTIINVNKNDAFTYDGFQWKIAAKWQPLSDLEVSTNIAQFIPESGNQRFQLNFKVKLAF